MKKTLTDLLRLFIVINLIVLAFHMLPSTSPARQQTSATGPVERNTTLFLVHEDAKQCLKPGRNLPWQPPPVYQTTAYQLPR